MAQPGVYVITNIRTGTVYVGQSVDVRMRWRQHLHQLRKRLHGNTRLQRSFDKHGPAAFSFVIACAVDDVEELHVREEAMLNAYKAAGVGVYNLAGPVRAPNLGRKFSSVTRARMSASRTGLKRSPETCANMSRALRGIPCPEHRKKKISATLRGRALPEAEAARKREILASLHADPLMVEKMRRANDTRRKSIGRYDQTTGALVAVYTSSRAVALEGYSRSHVISVLRGRLRQHKGFHWRYVEDTCSTP